jgi:hypothetical protein
MSLHHSPRIVTDGLVLCLDAANLKSFSGGENLISYSTYNAATWSNIFPGTATLTTGITAPDNTNTAVRFSCNNTGNAILRVSLPAFTPNGTDVYTTSFFVRRVSGTGNAGTDLNDGAPSVNYSSQLITGQWVRVNVSGTPSSASKNFIDLYSDSNTNLVLDFWAAQLEKNTIATNYTPTNGTTITRSNVWRDISSSSSTITLFGPPTYDSRGYFTFANNQVTQYAMNSSYSIPTNDITMSCWFNSNFLNFSQVPFTYSVNGDNTYLLFTDNSSTIVPHDFGDRYPITVPNMANRWCNFIWTRVRSTGVSTYYLDGVQVGIRTIFPGTGPVSPGHLIIGQEADSPGGGFDPGQNLDGSFARLDIYNRALSSTEVLQNFNALRGRFGL